MKYYILYNSELLLPLREKSSDQFEDLQQLELLTNFNNLTSFLEEVMNNVLKVKLVTPPGNELQILSGASVYNDP